MQVVSSGSTSSALEVSEDVPPLSSLGLPLFTIYINDTICATSMFYADDLFFFISQRLLLTWYHKSADCFGCI